MTPPPPTVKNFSNTAPLLLSQSTDPPLIPKAVTSFMDDPLNFIKKMEIIIFEEREKKQEEEEEEVKLNPKLN